MTSRQTTALWNHDAHSLAGMIADRKVRATEVVEALSREGLPIGVQLVTGPFTERRELATAGHIEDTIRMQTPIDPRPSTACTTER